MSALADAARAAVPYGLATVDLHRILTNFALRPDSPEYKGPLNTIRHARAPADPNDLSVVAMNVDTLYSYAWLDLRTGPVLLTTPAQEPGRYQSVQVVDLYTYIVGYVSPRTTGPAGGTFLVRGPSTMADVAADDVFACTTDLCLVLVRTQVFDENDLPHVHALQDGIGITPLGFAGEPLPDIPPVDVRAELDQRFLHVLDTMLDLMPALPEDARIRAQLSEIGVGTGRLDTVTADGAARAQITEGLAAGIDDVRRRCARVRSSAELFGSRTFFGGDHLSRAAGAYLGILGNSAEEYLGVGYRVDDHGEPFHGRHEYLITFDANGFPPVDAFWSITVYDGAQHLYANELGRHVLGSRHVADMKRDDGGRITIRVAHRDPGPEHRANWLPCPRGPFGLTFRTYLPGAAVRDGSWVAPPVRRIT